MSDKTESMECVNLETVYGERFQITRDPACSACCKDPRTFIIPCERRGEIYPHGGRLIACQVDGRPITAAKIEALPGAIVTQEGDRDKTVIVDVIHAEAVFKIMKPRKRRRLSEEQRRIQAERLKDFRFPSAGEGPKSDDKSDPKENPPFGTD